MAVVKDVASAAMPYVVLGAIAVGIYVFRDRITGWLKGAVVPDSVEKFIADVKTDSDNDNWNDAGIGVVDPNKPLWEGSLITLNPMTGERWGFLDSGPKEVVDVIHVSDLNGAPPAAWNPPSKTWVETIAERVPLVTEGYGEALQNVSNLVTGTAADAFANAERIRVADTKPSYLTWTYNDFASLDTNSLLAPIGVNDSMQPVDLIQGDKALSISPRGWAVWRLDTGRMVTGVSGGTAPFARSDFAFWAKEFGV